MTDQTRTVPGDRPIRLAVGAALLGGRGVLQLDAVIPAVAVVVQVGDLAAACEDLADRRRGLAGEAEVREYEGRPVARRRIGLRPGAAGALALLLRERDARGPRLGTLLGYGSASDGFQWSRKRAT